MRKKCLLLLLLSLLLLLLLLLLLRGNGMWVATTENVPSDTCAQRRFRSAFAFAQSDQNLHRMHFEFPMMQYFFMLTAKSLIKLRGCAGWFDLLWAICQKVRFLTFRIIFLLYLIVRQCLWSTNLPFHKLDCSTLTAKNDTSWKACKSQVVFRLTWQLSTQIYDDTGVSV